MHHSTRLTSRGALLLTLAVVVGALEAATEPQVTNVIAQQRADGSGLVDVYYTLSGVAGTAAVAVKSTGADPRAAFMGMKGCFHSIAGFIRCRATPGLQCPAMGF